MRKLWAAVFVSYLINGYLLSLVIDKLMNFKLYLAILVARKEYYMFSAYPYHLMPVVLAAIITYIIFHFAYKGRLDFVMTWFQPMRKPYAGLPTEDYLTNGKMANLMNQHLETLGRKPINYNFFVAEDPEPNAFAWGRNNICVSTGILECGNLEIIMAIMMHEAAHLSNGDTHLGMCHFFGNFLIFPVQNFWDKSNNLLRKGNEKVLYDVKTGGSGVPDFGFMMGVIGFLCLSALFAGYALVFIPFTVVKSLFDLVRHEQEFAADALAGQFYKDGMIEFIEHISQYQYYNLFIVEYYFESHPSPRERLAKLHTLEMIEE